MFVKVREPWREQPSNPRRLNKTPLTRGLIFAFTPTTGGGKSPINAAHKRGGSAPKADAATKWAEGKLGRAWKWTGTGTDSRLIVGSDSQLSTSAITVFMIRRPTDTTARAASHFGGNGTGGALCQSHLPWSNGTVFWDFGGTGSTQRVTWSGYSKNTSVIDHWCLTHGARGKDIWHNGQRKSFSATSSTRTTSGDFFLNYGRGSNKGDLVEVYLFLVWDRQLSEGEIRALYSNPWQVFEPRTISIHIPAAVGGANPKGPLGMPLHGPLAGPVYL